MKTIEERKKMLNEIDTLAKKKESIRDDIIESIHYDIELLQTLGYVFTIDIPTGTMADDKFFDVTFREVDNRIEVQFSERTY